MNQVIETLMNHRSIRKFSDKPLNNVQIRTIVESAQRASTSSNVMAYSIIGVSDQDLKEKLYDISGHKHVKKNGHLLIFCADLHRLEQLDGIEHTENLESTEQFIVGTIDAALAAQNAVVSAESLGLGICFLGSLRNDIPGFQRCSGITGSCGSIVRPGDWLSGRNTGYQTTFAVSGNLSRKSVYSF